MTRKTLAIPIRLVKFRDTSQVLTLFTRDFGSVECIAKGSFRERNAFQGPFDLAVIWEVVFVERAPGRGLSIVTEAVVVEPFRGVRRSWDRWVAAAQVIEFLRTVATVGDPAVELFDLTASVLAAISDPPEKAVDRPAPGPVWTSRALCAFEARALRLLGLNAPITCCMSCDRPWSRSDRPVFYSPRAGGILCGRCQATRHGEGRMVAGTVVKVFEALTGGSGPLQSENFPEELAGPSWLADNSCDLDSLMELTRFVNELCTFSLEREFEMLKYRIDLK